MCFLFPTSEEECAAAFAKFNGRWFAGKQCSCEFSPVTKWKSAICGMSHTLYTEASPVVFGFEGQYQCLEVDIILKLILNNIIM